MNLKYYSKHFEVQSNFVKYICMEKQKIFKRIRKNFEQKLKYVVK